MGSVMIVSSDSISNAIFKAHLEPDYTGIEISSGVQALGFLKSNPLPDLILMDVEMTTGMNGLEVLKVLQQDERTRDIPVIFTLMDHHSALSILPTPYEHGAPETVTRPVTEIQLLRRTAYQLEIKRLRQENSRLKAQLQQYTNGGETC